MEKKKKYNNTDINMLIGQRLKEVRENGGYSQLVFSEALGVGEEHYRKLENEIYRLQPEKMLILYEQYKIDPNYLINGVRMEDFDVELFIANCSKEQRDDFIKRVFNCTINLIMQKL